MRNVLAIHFGYRPVAVEGAAGTVIRLKHLCSYGWKNLHHFPSATFLSEEEEDAMVYAGNKRFTDTMAADIPEDEAGTGPCLYSSMSLSLPSLPPFLPLSPTFGIAIDILCESLVGLETFALMKDAVARLKESGASASALSMISEGMVFQRRVVLVKWLYVHGFLEYDVFPPPEGPGTPFVPVHMRDEQ